MTSRNNTSCQALIFPKEITKQKLCLVWIKQTHITLMDKALNKIIGAANGDHGKNLVLNCIPSKFLGRTRKLSHTVEIVSECLSIRMFNNLTSFLYPYTFMSLYLTIVMNLNKYTAK